MEQELCFYMVRRRLDRLHAAGKLTDDEMRTAADLLIQRRFTVGCIG